MEACGFQNKKLKKEVQEYDLEESNFHNLLLGKEEIWNKANESNIKARSYICLSFRVLEKWKFQEYWSPWEHK